MHMPRHQACSALIGHKKPGPLDVKQAAQFFQTHNIVAAPVKQVQVVIVHQVWCV